MTKDTQQQQQKEFDPAAIMRTGWKVWCNIAGVIMAFNVIFIIIYATA